MNFFKTGHIYINLDHVRVVKELILDNPNGTMKALGLYGEDDREITRILMDEDIEKLKERLSK